MRAFFLSLLIGANFLGHSALATTDFANKYCQGDCQNLLMIDFDPSGPLTVDEHYLIQYYTESYNIVDVEMFINAISKLPDSNTIVYRGTQKKHTGADKVGKIIQLDRISSTSTDRYTAESFLGDQLLVIKAKSAKNITDYSVSNEQEHILLPGTKLRVDKITTEKVDLTNQTEERIVDIEVVYLTEL